jgi:alpha-amylase/alpha-mannosidase (GH57 family)
MTNPGAPKPQYICIHGHFYQPPRENPWLEEIEREESAGPYHDWNQRINAECYRANGAARRVDDKNRILTLNNNYKSLSFNFGPTLLRWIERNDPWVYKTIIEADRESCSRFDGHGNGMAQAYNHIIMPLANRRDKVTQVLWGMRDFENRFGRSPEGMWLAETAVDNETLEVMANAGIKFTVLSPFQAARWRFLEKGAAWNDAEGGSIPTGRAYRYVCRNGKTIHLFFYDGSVAKGIAFERLLEHSSKLVAALRGAHEKSQPLPGEPWLVNTATDGESYGHHFKFGDMALAAAFQEFREDPESEIINYSAFLAAFPVRAEVEIHENTAWSCAHGLGRWQADCGCHIGGGPGWNQRWRAPLREAMNHLRDRLAAHYQREMELLTEDPWKVRDEYLEVLLDREHRSADFARRHFRRGLPASAIPRFFQLLEMQRSTMYMYTSCGWFFDEISSLESVLILRHAARAIQLAEQTGAQPLEPSFLEILGKAPSNDPEYGNGAEVYLRKVKPEVMEKDRVAANYAIQAITRSYHPSSRLYCFSVTPEHEEDLGPNPAPCLYGHVTVKDERTQAEQDYVYTVIHFTGLDVRCSVKPYRDAEEYKAILEDLERAVEGQNTVNMIRVLDKVFGPAYFSLHDAFRDLRSTIALEISQKKLAIYTEFQRHLYQAYKPLMLSLKQWGTVIPSDLRGAVRRVLSDEVDQLVDEMLKHEVELAYAARPWKETDFFYRAHLGRLRSLLEDARSWGIVLRMQDVSAKMGQALLESLTLLSQIFAPQDARRLFQLITICRTVGIKPELWKLQTLYFDLVGSARRSPGLATRISDLEELLNELDLFLECRFARFLSESGKAG